MATTWTPERRVRQAELIGTWKPWLQATGPRTADGKARASLNAYKGGHWLKLRELTKMVNAEIRQAQELVDGMKTGGAAEHRIGGLSGGLHALP